ncbi:MAG TPA: hypothetical protein VIL36_17735 [Acidimicrobiales bacterium]
MDATDDALLDAVADHAEELADLDLPAVTDRLRAITRDTLRARRPDGSWPDDDVLAEVLRAHLDLLDDRLAAEGLTEHDLPGDTRWVDAWRTAARHPETLAAMLAALREDLDDEDLKMPNYPPPAELHIVTEP